mmetsp:Transcript_11161/g.20746  ORF Transcript_11161/g.20746 Transcript_11161/m.20746 type:complete len:568 (+) Transcript_11161:655-2358(+)
MRFNNLQRMNKIGRQRPLWNLVSKRTFRLDPQQYTKLLGDSINPDTREEFWGQAANELEWFKPFEQTLDNSNAPFTKWFKGGQLNVCYNAVDRWVEQGQGGQVAIYYDSPLSDTKKAYTFAELQDQVARFAGVLSQGGVQKGDRVVIYMPMIPEAVVAMLACARLGAVHSVVFGGFAAKELAVRIDDAKPKAVVSASFGIEPSRLVQYAPLLQGALEIAQHKPASVYVKHRQVPEKYAKEVIPVESSSIKDWDTEMDNATPHDAVPVLSTDPLYLLYTSGTTGQPKGVLRDSGGYATALKWSMEHFFDIKEKETFWAASDIGWVVGHSYIVYGPLLHGCSTVLYEGKPIFPDAGAFWRVISEYGVNGFFTAPTALRAIRKVDPELKLAANYDLSTLRATFLAGERADPETVKYFSKTLDKPIVDNYWQTELGWPALGYQIDGVGVKPGSASRALPGFDMHVLDEKTSEELEDDNLGDVGIKSPLPPGSFTTLYNADHRFKQAYFEKHKGYYMTGDAGIRDADGYFHSKCFIGYFQRFAKIFQQSWQEPMMLSTVPDTDCLRGAWKKY